VGGNDAFHNAFLATNGGARVGRSATTTAAAGGGDAVGAVGGGFGGGGPNVFGMMMQAQRNVQPDQQPKKRKMNINTKEQQQQQQQQYAVGQKKAPMKKNVGSSSSLPVSNGGDSQTARATTPRMTPTGPTTMLETQAFQRSHFERFSADQMMMMNSPTMNSPPPTTMTAYAGGYAFDAGEDVVVFDAEALAALASEEEKNKSELLQKAKTMNEKMKRCGKRDILLEEDSKIVIDFGDGSGNKRTVFDILKPSKQSQQKRQQPRKKRMTPGKNQPLIKTVFLKKDLLQNKGDSSSSPPSLLPSVSAPLATTTMQPAMTTRNEKIQKIQEKGIKDFFIVDEDVTVDDETETLERLLGAEDRDDENSEDDTDFGDYIELVEVTPASAETETRDASNAHSHVVKEEAALGVFVAIETLQRRFHEEVSNPLNADGSRPKCPTDLEGELWCFIHPIERDDGTFGSGKVFSSKRENMDAARKSVREGKSAVALRISLSFAGLSKEGAGMYRRYHGGPLSTSSTSRGTETLIRASMEALGGVNSDALTSADSVVDSVVTLCSNVCMDASYDRIPCGGEESDRVEAAKHRRFNGKNQLGTLTLDQTKTYMEKIVRILVDVTKETRAKSGLKKFAFEVNSVKCMIALYHAAIRIGTSEKEFNDLFPFQWTGVHPSLYVRNIWPSVLLERLQTLCQYFNGTSILPFRLGERVILPYRNFASASAANKTCVTCNSTTTSVAWYKSKVHHGRDLCTRCYQIEHSSLANKTCGTCNAKTTSSAWYKSKVHHGRDLCTRCYQIEKSSLANKTCGTCNATTTSSGWKKSKVHHGRDLCHGCYKKEHASLANKTCGTCNATTTSSGWTKSKVHHGRDLCSSCYKKENSSLANKTCGTCNATTTSSGCWTKSKVHHGRDLCNRCYKKETYYIRKKGNT